MWLPGRLLCGHVAARKATVWSCGCQEGYCVVMWLPGRLLCGHVAARKATVWSCGCQEGYCVVMWLPGRQLCGHVAARKATVVMWLPGRQLCGHVAARKATVWSCGCQEGYCGHVAARKATVWSCGCQEGYCVVMWLPGRLLCGHVAARKATVWSWQENISLGSLWCKISTYIYLSHSNLDKLILITAFTFSNQTGCTVIFMPSSLSSDMETVKIGCKHTRTYTKCQLNPFEMHYVSVFYFISIMF